MKWFEENGFAMLMAGVFLFFFSVVGFLFADRMLAGQHERAMDRLKFDRACPPPIPQARP